MDEDYVDYDEDYEDAEEDDDEEEDEDDNEDEPVRHWLLLPNPIPGWKMVISAFKEIFGDSI